MTKNTKNDARQLRRNLDKLRRKGLIKSSKVSDKYARELNRKFRDVITGDAFVVTVKDKAARQKYRAVFKGSAEKIVVPKDRLSKTARFSKRDETIKTYSQYGGDSFVKTVLPEREVSGSLPQLKANQSYLLPMRGEGGRIFVQSFASLEDLQAFVNQYSSRGNFKRAMEYVSIGEKRKPKRRKRMEEDDEGEE